MIKLVKWLAVAMLIIQSAAAIAKQQEDSPEQRQQRKIIALAPHIVENLFAIGAGQQIIGTTDHADYPQQANDILRIGNYARLQIEKIVQLQPDLIIAWKSGNPNEDLERLEKYGIPIVYSNPKTLADVATEIRKLGEVTGREAKAEQLANQYSQNLRELQSKYADKTPVTVFYELWARPIRTVANQAWLQQQVELCGGDNPFKSSASDYPQVGLEQVLVTLPQVVVQPLPHSGAAPELLDWSQWPHIPAVKHGFILNPDPDKTHRTTLRVLAEVDKMCTEIDLARQFYNKELTS